MHDATESGRRRLLASGFVLLTGSLLLCWVSCREAGSAWNFGSETRVLLVLRAGDPAAARIAQRYVAARHLAESHVLSISCPGVETIDRAVYASLIEGPIADWWRRCPEEHRPDYLLLVKGIPHKITGSGGIDGDRASVDSELTRIPRVAGGERPPLQGPERNRYFDARDASGRYAVFEWRKFGICLVCRLDGYTEADAIALIERSLDAASSILEPSYASSGADSVASAGRDSAAEASALLEPGPAGTFLIDLRGDGDGAGQEWLRRAAGEVDRRRGSVVLDEAPAFVSDLDGLIGYASWGSNDPAYQRPFQLGWLPGALACTFVSSSARTFREPPLDWTPGPAASSEHRFEGSTQSLIADFVRSGVTGASGNAYEPYLSLCVRPDILFGAALEGRALGESFYLALPGISWQAVILGDPLCSIRSDAIAGSPDQPRIH